MANEHKSQLKCGRPLGLKDIILRKMKNVQINVPEKHTNIKGSKEINLEPQVDELVTPKEALIKKLSLETIPIHNNEEILINYIYKGKIWDQNTTLTYDVFLSK